MNKDAKIKIPLKEKIAYGFSDMGAMGATYMINTYLMMFLTNVAGLSAAVVGTILLAAMLFDAINDPIIGSLADRSHFRNGKYRPWMYTFAIPFAACSFLLFIKVPFGTAGKIAYYTIIYLLFTVAETAFCMPQGALPTTMTNDQGERNILGAFRDWGSNFFNFAAGFILVYILSGFSEDKQNFDEHGFFFCALFVCIAATIFLLISALGTKERITPEPMEKAEKTSFKVLVKSVLQNRPAMCIVGLAMFVNLFVGFRSMFTTYYASYYLGDPMVMSTLFTVMSVVPLIGLPFVPKLMKLLGSKKMFIMSGCFAILCGIFTLAAGRNIPMIVISYLFSGLTLAGVYANIWGTMPACADYGEWKTGVVSAGLVCAMGTFAMKVGGALASYGSGWLLTFAQYDATAEVQSEFTQHFIYMAHGIIPICCGILAILLVLPFNLTQETITKVEQELNERRGITK